MCTSTCRIHTLLETNQYVGCVLIHFSKTFDTIDHVIRARKLSCIKVHFYIIHWIMPFLTNRSQATLLLYTLPINRSIVQGSGIGPTLFIMLACDLKPLDILNYFIKYTYNVTLLSPRRSKTTDELKTGVINRAIENKMTVSLLKTFEIVFHIPNMYLMIYFHIQCKMPVF